MQSRSLVKVFLLTLVTFGIYGLYWEVKTKGEMNARGAHIPTAWLLVVPFVNIWWLWKYSEGIEQTTQGKLSTVISFLVLFLLGIIGMLIIQDSFNKVGEAVAASAPAPNPVAAGGGDGVTPVASSAEAPTPPTNPVV